MSDLSSALSLAEKARRLAALARAKRESETESQDQVRFEAQIAKLTVEMGTLNKALATHRRLESAGVPVNSLPDLKRAPRELRDQVSRIGRPTWQYINARVTSLAKAHVAIIESDTAAWQAWARDQISGLPLALVPRLGFERRSTEGRVATLRKLASAAPIPASLSEFQSLFERVENDLKRVESAGVDAVLARFVQGRMLLADLSEEELALLRSENALRTQLYVALS